MTWMKTGIYSSQYYIVNNDKECVLGWVDLWGIVSAFQQTMTCVGRQGTDGQVDTG